MLRSTSAWKPSRACSRRTKGEREMGSQFLGSDDGGGAGGGRGGGGIGFGIGGQSILRARPSARASQLSRTGHHNRTERILFQSRFNMSASAALLFYPAPGGKEEGPG